MLSMQEWREEMKRREDARIAKKEEDRRKAEKLAPMVPWLRKGAFYWVEWCNDSTGHGDEFYTSSRWAAVLQFFSYMGQGHDWVALKIDDPDRGTLTIFTENTVPALA